MPETATASSEEENYVRISPNPANDQVTLTIEALQSVNSISLLNWQEKKFVKLNCPVQ
jgi:hypothetical protein